MPDIYPQNCLFPVDDLHPSNTPTPRPTPLTSRNGTQIIQSAVLPQYTPDRPTDRQTDRQMGMTTSLYQHRLRSTDCIATQLYWAARNCDILSYSFSLSSQIFIPLIVYLMHS